MKFKILISLFSLCLFTLSCQAQNETPQQTISTSAFQTWISQFPKINLPQAFPLSLEQRKIMPKKALTADELKKYICEGDHFPCGQKNERTQHFAVWQLPISKEAVGLIIHSIGDLSVETVLITYNADNGTKIQRHVLSGTYGDAAYGYEGFLEKDLTMTQTQTAFVNGTDKEFVKVLDFKIKPHGEIQFVINP